MSEINIEKTNFLQSQSKWQDYKAWLIDNGCKFPSIDFPVAFGDHGVVGIAAKNNIHIKKAFLFVPFHIIITPQVANNSELKEVFKSFPKIFDDSPISWDYRLWLFLMNEKRKGESSFYWLYINIIDSPEILIDWTQEEMKELQDEFLTEKSEKYRKSVEWHYKNLSKVFENFPQYFGQDTYERFYWAYRIVTTRSFCQNEGMIVPLADNLNHDDVSVDYITLSEEFLQYRSKGKSLTNDYQDFNDEHRSSMNIMKVQRKVNRLQQYLSWFEIEKIADLGAIWEVDNILHDFESSSSDLEDPIHITTSNESSEEEEGDYLDIRFDPSDKYFIMRTADNSSFRQGEQVFNCYGRLNNFDLLLNYGFSLYPNRFDSYYLRLFKCKLVSPNKRKKRGTRTFNLKRANLNLPLLKYLRKRLNKRSEYSDLQSSAVSELRILEYFTSLIGSVKASYLTSLAEDKLLLSDSSLSIRQIFAVRYRVSRKEIIEGQLKLCNDLEDILLKVGSGMTVREAHWSDRDAESILRVYPLRTYLNKLDNRKLW